MFVVPPVPIPIPLPAPEEVSLDEVQWVPLALAFGIVFGIKELVKKHGAGAQVRDDCGFDRSDVVGCEYVGALDGAERSAPDAEVL